MSDKERGREIREAFNFQKKAGMHSFITEYREMFLKVTQNKDVIKEIIDKNEYIKIILKAIPWENNIIKNQKIADQLEKIFAINTTDEGLVSLTYKELLNFLGKKVYKPIGKMGKRQEQTWQIKR